MKNDLSFTHHSSFRIHHFCFMRSTLEDYVPQYTPRASADTRARLVWCVIVVGAFAFLGLLACAPLAQAQGHAGVARALYHTFGAVCHQLPARSYYLNGQPLAVCARCTGIYAGFAVGALCYPLVRSLVRTDIPARRWLLLAALPACVDFTLGVTGLWANTHTSRALTGALLGATMAFYIVPGLLDLSRLLRRRAGGTQVARAVIL
jgi:uncharacterized membrane protein